MEEKKFLQLNDIEAYKIAFHLSNFVWDIVMVWEHFPKTTIGRQFVDAVDSISANIAEGFGRHFKKDKINFYRYSKGSLKECFMRRRELEAWLVKNNIHIFSMS